MNVELAKGILFGLWMVLIILGHYLEKISTDAYMICMVVMISGIVFSK